MASADSAQPRGTQLGSRLSVIIQELQKRQTTEAPSTLEAHKLKRLSFVPEVAVAIMGVTGAGKSSFIRKVTANEEVQVGDSLRSTFSDTKVQPFTFEHEGKKFSIIDTPGFNDTYRSDNDVLKELADWLLESYRDGVKISGIVYLHRISDPRMEGSALRNLRMFRKLCGDEFMKNVILGTTFWDVVDEETGAAREDELLQTDGFFKDMKERGCDVVRISDDRNTCLELLSRFAAKPPTVMRIQQELFEGKSLAQTAAASAVSQELAELQRQNQQKLADVEHQAQKKTVRSSLEMAYTRHLNQRAFEGTMEALSTQQEEVRKETEEEERVCEEKLATLKREVSRQNQNHQVELNELRDQLQALRARATY